MTALSTDQEIDGDQTTIRISGELDLETAPQLIRLATGAVNRSEMTELVIDLSEVSFMDSAGIGGLLRAHRLCDEHGAELRVRGAPPRLRRILAITGLATWFGIPEGDVGR